MAGRPFQSEHRGKVWDPSKGETVPRYPVMTGSAPMRGLRASVLINPHKFASCQKVYKGEGFALKAASRAGTF